MPLFNLPGLNFLMDAVMREEAGSIIPIVMASTWGVPDFKGLHSVDASREQGSYDMV